MVNKIKTPKKTDGDAIHAIIKMGLSGIPGLGGPASELFCNIIPPPIMKRNIEWMNLVGEKINKLEKEFKDFKQKELPQNKIFVTVLIQSTNAAIRTTQEEKINALCNAVLNSAITKEPEEDFKLMLIRFVSDLGGWHLKVLKFLNELDWDGLNAEQAICKRLEKEFPELEGKIEFTRQILRDLESRGLLKKPFNDGTTGPTMSAKVSEIGKELIKFITSPLKEN